ncbi:hypothetical protein IQ209_02325 [Xenorhabdus sp. BG5]|nr:hypothetical protein [Xenorhabdus sp. BG5]
MLAQALTEQYQQYGNWHFLTQNLTVEQYQQVFECFYRCESSRNRTSGGSGLGLAICYNIAEAHNGIIHAESSSLGGIKIHVEFT